jgi:hypothetical protein
MPEGTYTIKLCYSHVLIFLLEIKIYLLLRNIILYVHRK